MATQPPVKPPDYGVDIAIYPDLSPTFALVSGSAQVKQALWCRFKTRRGTNPEDPDYGLDLTEMIGDDISPYDAYKWSAAIESESLKDERVISAGAEVDYDEKSGSASVTLLVDIGQGPFKLVLSVTSVTVELLNGEEPTT